MSKLQCLKLERNALKVADSEYCDADKITTRTPACSLKKPSHSELFRKV